jgi:transcriptional regulator GlxA family with amidase domain
MLTYAARWPIDRTGRAIVADSFFETLALLARDWLDRAEPLCLPTSTDPLVRAVMDHTQDHLADIRVADLCRAVGVSQRTLRRRFADTVGMTWREYLLQSRLLRAMALLGESDRGVVDVANQVGFDSVSAFSRAFRGLNGETPAAYRRRVAGRASTAVPPVVAAALSSNHAAQPR